jgi:hypothetical protein
LHYSLRKAESLAYGDVKNTTAFVERCNVDHIKLNSPKSKEIPNASYHNVLVALGFLRF